MRSLMLGDCDHYASPYMRGVAQAMKLLGHPHAEVSLRSPARVIEQRVRMWRPDIIWTHMLLWPPKGSPPVDDLISIVVDAAKLGARVVIHDGDAKSATRHPHDVSDWCALALVNHGYDRSAWKVPVRNWPYFARAQDTIAPVDPGLRCELFFAGRGGSSATYAARTELLEGIRSKGIGVKTPQTGVNTLDATPEIAASAGAVLGFGRPEVPGWVDTRVFQYPGAGGILLHDDVQGFLEPWAHYVPYESGSAESVVEALQKLRLLTDGERMALRNRAFTFVQARHSSVARVRQVFAELGLS